MSDIAILQRQIGEWAKHKGWAPFDKRDIPTKIALMHSELSEALEEYRDDWPVNAERYTDGGKPEGIGIELADCVIRILEFCDNFDIKLDQLIRIKMDYNEGRPFRHGGKIA